tara:strand:+ start:350 stop:580 length:231 start_codon:yes stop_codon:yes gene_type:complete
MSRWRINVTRGTRFIGEKGSATSEVVQFTKIVKLRFSEKGLETFFRKPQFYNFVSPLLWFSAKVPLSHNLKISTRT